MRVGVAAAYSPIALEIIVDSLLHLSWYLLCFAKRFVSVLLCSLNRSDVFPVRILIQKQR